MAETNHTLKALNQLEKTIKAQRAQLLEAHGVLTCLYEVLLHADGEQAVPYAQVADVAISLMNKSAPELDSVRIWPLTKRSRPLLTESKNREICTSTEGRSCPTLPRMCGMCGEGFGDVHGPAAYTRRPDAICVVPEHRAETSPQHALPDHRQDLGNRDDRDEFWNSRARPPSKEIWSRPMA
jgi:hypothetical protein